MDLTRRLPEGFAERKTARVSRRWQAATLRLSASVQRAQGAPGSRSPPPCPTGTGALGHARPAIQPGRDLAAS